MKIIRSATAGTLESSDALITVAPAGDIEINIDSVVKKQFGEAIEASVRDMLKEFSVTGVHLSVEDRGAVDCVLRARIETALCRGAKEE